MSISIVISCDGYMCHNSTEINVNPDDSIENRIKDSTYTEIDGFQYCAKCVVEINKEP